MRTVQRMLAGFMVLFAASAVAHASDQLCGTPSMAPSEKLQQLQAARSLETSRDSQYIAYRESAGITRTFPQPVTPPHPALVCRHIVSTEGQLELETNAKCLASQQA